MLNPTPLLSSLRFRVTGSSQVAGRATVTAHAVARPYDPRHGRSLGLHQLGTGAHHYQLEVDQERGVLLAVTAIRDEQPFHKITAMAIRFDEPIAAETFQFNPPENPPSFLFAASTRWQGTKTGIGLAPQAPPTARTAFGLPTARAISP